MVYFWAISLFVMLFTIPQEKLKMRCYDRDNNMTYEGDFVSRRVIKEGNIERGEDVIHVGTTTYQCYSYEAYSVRE